MTKIELARKLGITRQYLHRLETDQASPGAATLEALSRTLAFPVEFFQSEQALPKIEPEGASFRSLSTMTKSQRDSVIAAGTLAIYICEHLGSLLRLPVANVPDMYEETPESAAVALRSLWGRGQQPIRNMISLVEAHGVRVFSIPPEHLTVDAFTVRHGDYPYIFLNSMKSAERSRFDCAHELGHLVLHQHGVPTGRNAEAEANAFASAFLMPTDDVRAHAPRVTTLPSLISGKRRWGVSVAAYARRLHDVGLLRERQYKQLSIAISSHGWRKTEPNTIARETSQLLPKAFALLRDLGVKRSDVARTLALPSSEMDALLFGMTITALPGNRTQHDQQSRRAELKLVGE